MALSASRSSLAIVSIPNKGRLIIKFPCSDYLFQIGITAEIASSFFPALVILMFASVVLILYVVVFIFLHF